MFDERRRKCICAPVFWWRYPHLFFEEKDGLADLQTPQKKNFGVFGIYTACVGLGERRANRGEGHFYRIARPNDTQNSTSAFLCICWILLDCGANVSLDQEERGYKGGRKLGFFIGEKGEGGIYGRAMAKRGGGRSTFFLC